MNPPTDVLSVYISSHAGIAGPGESIRRMRTLVGNGLHLVAAIALEVRWVFDAARADVYVREVFAHNACLAPALVRRNKRFEPATHASFG